MGRARRYILNVNSYVPYGVCTSGITTQYNLTSEFSLMCDDVELNYPPINLTTLSNLSDDEYEKRMNDFLLYVGTLPYEFDTLKNNAVFETDDCIVCLINPNFNVVKYDDGVQIIDIGNTYGIPQYAIVNVGVTPTDSDWQNNNIFLNVDYNLTYDVYVRDYNVNDDDVYCQHYQTVDFSQFIETRDLEVSVVENAYINALHTKRGEIKTSLPLNVDDNITIYYEVGSSKIGESMVNTQVYCKPHNGDVYDLLNTTPNYSSSVLMGFGDSICFNLEVDTPTYGDTGHSYICILDVVGNEHVNATINNMYDCVGLTQDAGIYDVVLSLGDRTEYVELRDKTVEGKFIYDPPSGIPVNECIAVDMSFSKLIDGDAITTGIIYCKPKNGTQWLEIGNESQNHHSNFEVCEGDEICYRLHITPESANSDITLGLTIDNVNPLTNGINPSIGTINYDSVNVSTPTYLVSLIEAASNQVFTGYGEIFIDPDMYSDDFDLTFGLCAMASKRLPDPAPESRDLDPDIPIDGPGPQPDDPNSEPPDDGSSGGGVIPGGKAIAKVTIYCNGEIKSPPLTADADANSNYSENCYKEYTHTIKANEDWRVCYTLFNDVDDVTGDGNPDGSSSMMIKILKSNTNNDNYDINTSLCSMSCYNNGT